MHGTGHRLHPVAVRGRQRRRRCGRTIRWPNETRAGHRCPRVPGAFHSTDFKTPIGRLSEYVEVLRRSWDYLAGEPVGNFEGKHYQFAAPPINPWGLREQPTRQIPILVAGMRPNLLKLVGAKADGWVGYLYTPKFYEQIVVPNVTEGARKAGRNADQLELSCEIICCVHPDRDIALARAKKHVGFYIAHPVSDIAAEIEGVQDLVNELRVAMMQKGPAAFEDTRKNSWSCSPSPAHPRNAGRNSTGTKTCRIWRCTRPTCRRSPPRSPRTATARSSMPSSAE